MGSVVMATGIAHVELTMKGKEAKFSLRYAAAYAKRAGVWQIFYYQGTRLPKADDIAQPESGMPNRQR